MNYINLYTLTEYTMLTSPLRLKELIRCAREYDYDALAITDLNNMHGVLKFYELCSENGIKPIIGLAIVLDSADNFYNSLLLYAKNNSGYRNLLKIASRAKIKGAVGFADLGMLLPDCSPCFPMTKARS